MDGHLATLVPLAADAADPSDWSLFQSGFISWFVDHALVWVAVWLVTVVAARALSIWKLWTRKPVTRSRSTEAKLVGAGVTALAAFAFVVVGSITSLIAPWLVVALIGVGVIATVGIVVLAFGMATTPWLRITVTGTGGATNDAWATEVTVRMRELNADNPKGRIERPDGSDLNELVAIADRTDNWAFALVGGAVSMLFNLTPWRLEVTVFNSVSGVARLRRNGRVVDDASLQLPAPPADGGHPGELLTLAAAFAAVTVAHEYPDIVGFYNTNDWRGLGLIGVARITDDPALRERYIARAREVDPDSILVEYEDVYHRYAGATDARRLRELIERLEPMIASAALQAGRPIAGIGTEDESVTGATGTRSEPGKPEADASGARRSARRYVEPPMLMLRLQSYYLMTIRNWLVAADGSAKDDAAGGHADRPERLERATIVAAELVAALDELKREADAKQRRAQYAKQRTSLERMEQRAALGLLLLNDERMKSRTAADTAAVDDAEASARLRQRVELATGWKNIAKRSGLVEVKYSVACYESRRIAEGWADDDADFEFIVAQLGAVCGDDEYRQLALADPELAPLVDPRGDRARRIRMRDAVLLDMNDAWQIERFRRVRVPLERAGVRTPQDLVVPATQSRVVLRSDLDVDEVTSLADAARILHAVMTTECGLVPDRFDGRDADREHWARLRAARALLDDDRHTVQTLCDEHAQDRGTLVDELATAMFWRPDEREERTVGDYVDRMIERLGGPHGLPVAQPDEPAEPAEADERDAAGGRDEPAA
ncbi:MAG TPA: hypothetical protein VGE78_04695 [Agromyces sp.]